MCSSDPSVSQSAAGHPPDSTHSSALENPRLKPTSHLPPQDTSVTHTNPRQKRNGSPPAGVLRPPPQVPDHRTPAPAHRQPAVTLQTAEVTGHTTEILKDRTYSRTARTQGLRTDVHRERPHQERRSHKDREKVTDVRPQLCHGPPAGCTLGAVPHHPLVLAVPHHPVVLAVPHSRVCRPFTGGAPPSLSLPGGTRPSGVPYHQWPARCPGLETLGPALRMVPTTPSILLHQQPAG